MERTMCYQLVFLTSLLYLINCDSDVEQFLYETISTPHTSDRVTEIPGGVIANREQRLEKNRSPYLLREDLIVDWTGMLVIEPGVEVRFSPQVGLTVRGVFTARGLPGDGKITLTSASSPSSPPEVPKLRLVDGPSILAGRLQILHNNHWRSVCSNSRNWTTADLETACRQLGFQGGSWWNWVDRQAGNKPQILYEEPNCRGTETSIFDCNWASRQLGAGVCDYHPDLGIQCLPQHISSSNVVHHWRGIRFENARSERTLTQENTLYVRQSMSELSFVDIRYAGSGRDYNASSAIDIQGTPPKLANVAVLYSAYNGINVTVPNAPVVLNNCTLRSNRGYGLYINSTSGAALVDNCMVTENGADGVRYVHHDEITDEHLDRTDIFDFCTFPTTASQTFPISISVEQNKFMPTEKDCKKYFFTQRGHVLTLHFVSMVTDRNGSGTIELYDGSSLNDRLLASISIRNATKPQSISTTYHNVYVRYRAEPRTQLLVFMKLTSGYSKSYDLNVTRSTLADNNGRGVAIEGLRSLLHVHQSSISNNNHVAGIHVLDGAGDVNVSDSRIAFNQGDGINITYMGGNRNITRSYLSSNKGYGIAVWFNDSRDSEFVALTQETVVSFTEIFKNEDIGVFVGNFCGNALVNVTGNWFNNSLETAVEIQSCWKVSDGMLKVQVGHNIFIRNNKLGVKLKPALNIDAKIEYNHFKEHKFGAILVKNQLDYQQTIEFDILPANVAIEYNEFLDNEGVYVVNLGLSPYSEVQKLLFTRNFVRNNRVREPFDYGEGGVAKLVPRSRVAAPVVISSSNVDLFRNILHNPESNYEIGSHLEDQSKVINCTFNYLGFDKEENIFYRLFHRKDRYNLAKIVYLPFLLHSSNPGSTLIIDQHTFVPQFNKPGTSIVGGEVDGQESLREGEYDVQRDINVHPGGRLTLQPGVTLRFPPGVGMMIAGKLEAKGRGPNNIRLTLKEERVEVNTVNETEVPSDPVESKIPVRLLGGKTHREGRLQVRVDGKWGTVCDYGWTVVPAALVCHQLGLVLNPDDWLLERSEVPSAGTTEDVILSNVRCTEDDIDITQCRSEHSDDFENSCSHSNDVGLRCYDSSWAGVRLGVLAERSDLQFITVEKAGLFDYATNTFKPALQMDFARHALENVRVVDNLQDGLGIIYSDLYSMGAINTVKNSEFSNNRGSGISFKQLGLKISGSTLENNKVAGIRHNPALTNQEQRELAGWFVPGADSRATQYSPYTPVFIPSSSKDIFFDNGETKYFVTERVEQDDVHVTFFLKCKPGYVIGIQLLNPIQNRSTEQILFYDSQSVNQEAQVWNLRRDLVVFPTVSSSFGVVMDYRSGDTALGGAVIVISTIQAPVQDVKNRIVRGPVPTLTVIGSRIKRNQHGVWASYYNRYLNDVEDLHLRKANETIQIFSCDISHNTEEAILVNAPFWDVHHSNISEVTFMINNSLITDNGRGIHQFSRDLRSSNNLFHWILQDNTIERNNAGGFDVSLPYVWQYNENFTHSLYLANNTWRSNERFAFVVDGHFAQLNLTKNVFSDNKCKTGLISIRGMEKRMKIDENRIERNTGMFMIEFKADSQSEILGEVEANMFENEIKNNRFNSGTKGFQQVYKTPSFVVGFHGIQKVSVNRNLFGNNALDYELLAGIRTAKVNNAINVVENWWGTSDVTEIKKRLFDFDDWNNHAIATFRPYLMEDSIDSSVSVSWEQPAVVDLDNLGGRLKSSLTLQPRGRPYVVRADITVMPGVTLSIAPGVVMEFAPNVGILVLGVLMAKGRRAEEIIMRPLQDDSVESRRNRRSLGSMGAETIRLCTGRNCTFMAAPDQLLETSTMKEGFLEYYNHTTMQWVPICDDNFSERNAQVVCRELGFNPLNVYISHGTRIEYHPNSLTRIWSWPEPLQCSGEEARFSDCPIRLNGQLYGHHHECAWNDQFVFIHCGETNLEASQQYWGGIRFANGEFEQNTYENRIHDVVTHMTSQRAESVLEFVNITGAGILHNEKSPAIQSIVRSPAISNVNISRCASHGINLISPTDTTRLLFNSIEHTLGVGISALSLTGEGRQSDESSFTPLKEIHLPYHLFSLIDICDTAKEITIEERVLVYYKYDNNPVNCVKIFNSVYHSKPFGFRLLQFNLLNSTGKPGRPDSITLYDGDIYNVSSKIIGQIEVGSNNENKLFKTLLPSMSIKLFAHGGSNIHGFIAEIVTLPISAIGFNRDVQHNISYSILSDNWEGAISYASAGEVNPTVTMEWNQINRNCQKLYGNFTTCKAAVHMDIQNTQNIYFRNNLVRENQGGLFIRADSHGSATSLKGWVHNNLFADNINNPALTVEGRQSSPYQEVIIYRNFFTRNKVPYDNVIILKQVVSNFTYNYVQDNSGLHILEVSGFERVRLPIYQTTSHNGFYKNFALDRDTRGTIVAGTAGQHYVDNILYNPENDYEIVTVNTSINQQAWNFWKTPIDAKHNYWGYNESLAVSGRIRDRTDEPDLLEVDYRPFLMNNESILSGKCPPGWMQVGDTCYMYIGAPMTFYEAREFCRSVNASMPYVQSNYLNLYKFLRLQQETYQYYDHVWVQNIDRINQCTAFAYQTIDIDDCRRLNPFLCETDPKVLIDPLSWQDDVLSVAVIGVVGLAILLVAIAAGFWYSKSRHRHIERLERRNSIRQSLHSVRSIGLASSQANGFPEFGSRRKNPVPNQRSSPSMMQSSDYKKMMNGSLDSMDKSQFNSSVEDNQSYDIYEAHNPNASLARNLNYSPGFQVSNDVANPSFDLAYRNDGFRDNSTFASRDNWQSTTNSEYNDGLSTPDYLQNASTLPLDASLAMTDSTLGMKQGLAYENHHVQYTPRRSPGTERNLQLPLDNYHTIGLPAPVETNKSVEYLPYTPTSEYSYDANLLETDIDAPIQSPKSRTLHHTNYNGEPSTPFRSKSEMILEANLDLNEPSREGTTINRSKSQPLETAM